MASTATAVKPGPVASTRNPNLIALNSETKWINRFLDFHPEFALALRGGQLQIFDLATNAVVASAPDAQRLSSTCAALLSGSVTKNLGRSVARSWWRRHVCDDYPYADAM